MASWVSCSVCEKRFVPRFSYQRPSDGGGGPFFCSIGCKGRHAAQAAPESPQASTIHERTRAAGAAAGRHCVVCGREFALEYAYQVLQTKAGPKAVCSTACRKVAVPGNSEVPEPQKARVIAVLNQKGGTGKTTTAVSLAAGLALRGQRVLIVDLDAQGNVAVSLGLQSRRTVYHLLVDGTPYDQLLVRARANLDAIVADQSLAAAELDLVSARDRSRVLRGRLEPALARYDCIVLDCGPSLSLLNQNALTLAGEVLIPVSCDYLALVGVRQILRTLQHVQDVLLHEVEVLGVLPTLFDARNRISHQAVEALRGYFGEQVLPPVRINAKLKEAPSHKQTIFEYAPDSHGAADYQQVVDWVSDRGRTARSGAPPKPAPAEAEASEPRAARAGVPGNPRSAGAPS